MKLQNKAESKNPGLALVMTEPERAAGQRPPLPDITPVYWTPEEFAEFYRVKPRWVYAQARMKGEERLPHLRLGKYIRINVNSPQFKAWLERHQVGG